MFTRDKETMASSCYQPVKPLRIAIIRYLLSVWWVLKMSIVSVWSCIHVHSFRWETGSFKKQTSILELNAWVLKFPVLNLKIINKSDWLKAHNSWVVLDSDLSVCTPCVLSWCWIMWHAGSSICCDGWWKCGFSFSLDTNLLSQPNLRPKAATVYIYIYMKYI